MLKYIQIESSYFSNLLQYIIAVNFTFYCILDQINAFLVSIRYLQINNPSIIYFIYKK